MGNCVFFHGDSQTILNTNLGFGGSIKKNLDGVTFKKYIAFAWSSCLLYKKGKDEPTPSDVIEYFSFFFCFFNPFWDRGDKYKRFGHSRI